MSDFTPHLDQASRVAAGATRTRYDNVAITLHWTTVALVVSLFALGELWGFTHRPLRHYLVVAHMSLGILLGLTVAVRIVWRLLPGHRVEPAGSGAIDRLARGVHWLLYGLLIVQALYGWVVRWSEGEAMSFFGLLIPSPLTPVARDTHHLLQEIHGKIGWAIVIVALGHAGAALYHHFVLKDAVLERMLPGRREAAPARAEPS
jgi:cytochrome b561